MKWKGVFNWQGTSYTLYTHGSTKSRAFLNFIHQMVKKVGYSFHHVYFHFMSGRDNYLMEERKS